MSSSILQEIACPNCQHPIDISEHGQQIGCPACNSRFVLRGQLCPRCNTYHTREVTFCGRCGTALSRTCARCQASNWTGDEYCIACGQPMDIFDLLQQRGSLDRQTLLEQRREVIRQLREASARASQDRMQAMLAEEAERLRGIREREARQREKDRRLLMVAFGALGLFVLMLLFVLLVQALS